MLAWIAAHPKTVACLSIAAAFLILVAYAQREHDRAEQARARTEVSETQTQIEQEVADVVDDSRQREGRLQDYGDVVLSDFREAAQARPEDVVLDSGGGGPRVDHAARGRRATRLFNDRARLLRERADAELGPLVGDGAAAVPEAGAS